MADVYYGYIFFAFLALIALTCCLYGSYKSKSMTPPPLSVSQKLKQGQSVTFEECYSYLTSNFSPEQKQKFAKELDLWLFPVFVKKFLEFKDSGKISAEEFEQNIRRLVLQMPME